MQYPAPEQTDNTPRPEDGEQDVPSTDPTAAINSDVEVYDPDEDGVEDETSADDVDEDDKVDDVDGGF